MRLLALTSCVILAVLASTASARAQTSTGAAAAAEVSTPLALSAQLGSSKLDPEAIRHAVELELKRPVALRAAPSSGSSPLLTVVVHANHTVSVSYLEASGTARTRTIGIPQDPARGAEVIALLAGNLSRDEAAELLAALAAKAGTPATAEPAPEATTPTAEPTAPAVAVKSQSAKAAAAPATPAAKPTPQVEPHAESLPKPSPAFNLSLFAPLSLYPHSDRLQLNGELGLFFSHVGELRGFGVNALALHTEHDVTGTSIATLYNRTGGTVHGAAIAAVFNSAQNIRGVQLSGISNFAGKLRGAQIAGVTNIAQDVNGVQVASVTNIARDVNGVQIGLVNIAGDVNGAQVGLVNIAKHVHGTSVGLVSIADNGRVQPVFWASTFMPLNAALKFIVGPLYTQAGLGYAPGNHTYVWELGLGAHIASGRYFLEPGAHYSEMRAAYRPFSHELLENLHYRLTAGLDLGALSPFVGAAVVQRFAHASDAPSSNAVTVEGLAGLAFF